MQTLRIVNTDIYEIEVNDKGETISFDLGDIELPFKLSRAYEGVKQAQDALRAKMLIIDRQTDKEGEIMSKNQTEKLNAWRDAFRDMRKAMDEFLGEGGCQKIFGSSNTLDMFDKLFEALSEKGDDGMSHLDRMKLSYDNMTDRIKAKYKIKESDTI